MNVILGGILPFGSIFIEMYFVFTSVWHYKYYYVYGFLFLVYVILIIVTVCVTVVSTYLWLFIHLFLLVAIMFDEIRYFLLNSEDYRWQWTSFLSAGSTAGYVYLYALYYFFVKTKMSGFYQTRYVIILLSSFKWRSNFQLAFILVTWSCFARGLEFCAVWWLLILYFWSSYLLLYRSYWFHWNISLRSQDI